MLPSKTDDAYSKKANDWSSISRESDADSLSWMLMSFVENLAAHRAQVLMTILPTAVAYGVAELEPTREHLKVRSFLTESYRSISPV
jgi:hypothetical protein